MVVADAVQGAEGSTDQSVGKGRGLIGPPGSKSGACLREGFPRNLGGPVVSTLVIRRGGRGRGPRNIQALGRSRPTVQRSESMGEEMVP